jgi:hypothetical protein
MESFKSWLNLNEEFALPLAVTKPIIDWVREQRNMYKQNPRTRRPDKTIVLDFFGTRFEKLNELPEEDRKVRLTTNYESDTQKRQYQKDDSWALYIPPNLTLDGLHKLLFMVDKNYDYGVGELMGIINHELMHAVQRLLAVHRKKDPKNLGFLSSRKLHKKLAKKLGANIYGATKDGIIDHRLRSMEHSTNLTSLLQEIEKKYYELKAKDSEDPLKVMNDKKMKKEFFKPSDYERLTWLKNHGVQDLYNYYLKKIETYFLNKEYTQDEIDGWKDLFDSHASFVNFKPGSIKREKKPAIKREKYDKNMTWSIESRLNYMKENKNKKWQIYWNEMIWALENSGIFEIKKYWPKLEHLIRRLEHDFILNKDKYIDGMKIPKTLAGVKKLAKNSKIISDEAKNTTDNREEALKLADAVDNLTKYIIKQVFDLDFFDRRFDDYLYYFGLDRYPPSLSS